MVMLAWPPTHPAADELRQVIEMPVPGVEAQVVLEDEGGEALLARTLQARLAAGSVFGEMALIENTTGRWEEIRCFALGAS